MRPLLFDPSPDVRGSNHGDDLTTSRMVTLWVAPVWNFKNLQVHLDSRCISSCAAGQADDAEPPDAELMGEMTEEKAMADWGQQFFLSFQIPILVPGNQRRLFGHTALFRCLLLLHGECAKIIMAAKRRWIVEDLVAAPCGFNVQRFWSYLNQGGGGL